jgi:hypothetical protein
MEESRKYKYYCEKCKYGTDIIHSMKSHEQSYIHQNGHKKSRKKIELYKCEDCEYINNHKYNYISHKLNHHGTKEDREKEFKYYCKLCDTGTYAKEAYDKHMISSKHKTKANNN